MVGAEAFGIAGDPAGGPEILRRIHRHGVAVPEPAAEPVAEVALPPAGFGRQVADQGDAAVVAAAEDGFVEGFKFGDRGGWPVGIESGVAEHLLVPMQGGDGGGDREAPEVATVGTDRPEDLQVLIGADAGGGGHPVEGDEGVVLGVNRDGRVGQGGEVGRIAAGGRKEQLAFELAHVQAADRYLGLGAVEILDDPVEGLLFEAGPAGPEGHLDRLIRGWLSGPAAGSGDEEETPEKDGEGAAERTGHQMTDSSGWTVLGMGAIGINRSGG